MKKKDEHKEEIEAAADGQPAVARKRGGGRSKAAKDDTSSAGAGEVSAASSATVASEGVLSEGAAGAGSSPAESAAEAVSSSNGVRGGSRKSARGAKKADGTAGSEAAEVAENEAVVASEENDETAVEAGSEAVGAEAVSSSKGVRGGSRKSARGAKQSDGAADLAAAEVAENEAVGSSEGNASGAEVAENEIVGALEEDAEEDVEEVGESSEEAVSEEAEAEAVEMTDGASEEASGADGEGETEEAEDGEDVADEGVEDADNEEVTEVEASDVTAPVGHTGYRPEALNDAIKYHLTGMYQDWFLDYASYVILERAVPALEDGLKPVQRRILHAMKCVDDGKMNKVANIVGQTMQYHPHGDASIGDALVQLGQKDLLIDCQGNWGNILTGDGAAAPRYIEARLSKFALETVFNPKTTHWMLSYDGRKKEPIHLPIKFPLLLAQGVEGIAVGLNSKILPHNFCELCEASLHYLRGEAFVLYPDFPTGGEIDVSRYNDGERGGMVKIRAKIQKADDNKTLIITEIPFGTTTSKIIETILRANQKGKIKVRKVDDFTAESARIVVQLAPGSSSDKAIDALYAFTDCEVNISPNCCVVENKKPIFTNVSHLLRLSTENTKSLLQWELQIEKAELEEKYFYTSLEKIFIENRIYKEEGYETAPNKEKLIAFVDKALEPWKPQLLREVRTEDIERLFEIRMIRITKFDSKKADELMRDLAKKIKEAQRHLDHLTEYTIEWFESLRAKYGAKYPRRTEVRNFVNINVKTVVEANEKLYINREEGFIGTGLKKDEFLCNCSDIDDVIVFHKDGKYKIQKVAEKLFIGTDILHIAIFKRNDDRTVYNVVYRDGKGGVYYMKRFNVMGVSRDKEYDLTQGKPGSRVMYFTANPNGEAEVIRVALKPALHLKKLEVCKDLSELAVKSRSARGNVLTKYEVKSITLKQKGHSTLGGRKVWFDPDVLRINYDGQGTYLGEFWDEDRILVITTTGEYYLTSFDLTAHFDQNILRIEKFAPEKVWSLALWNADQKYYYAKRFALGDDANQKAQSMLGDNKASRIVVLSDREEATFRVVPEDESREPIEVVMSDFIDVKSPKAKGKRITTLPVARIEDVTPEPVPEPEPEETDNQEDTPDETPSDGPIETEVGGVPLTITSEMPEDSKPIHSDGDDDQLSLF